MSSDRMVARIGGLLRQAESTDNPHEAEAFMEAAQRLATAASVDLAVARSHTASREKRATPMQRVVHIGEHGKKGLRTYVLLFVAIARANDVQCDVAQSSTQVFAYGFESDIDTCEALYASLLVQMVRASDTYISSGAYRDATVDREVTVVRGRRRYRTVERAPLAGVTARIEFQTAFAHRVGERLAAVKKEAEAEAVATEAPEAGTALVLRDKEIELRDFYRSASTARGTWRGSSGRSYSSEARRAGDHAGRRARLGNQSEIGGSRGQLER
ncbi:MULTISPECIES: DUF2786 domain-containing protein [Nocardiaceae]|uniref:DUF2786 domain-containing protein n=1 Tax=Rhodococcoides corynebacterioides TaxID=53972 RepID=A0ABS2KXH8_9NOCA|nr:MULTISPECIES: DUF2786 domain-containing protein [Rhodococcus]MBM7416642.1 hypothetical protein [Rhodococcus corynebacterioides]MBP1114895.1 hypothetical protein [Rhodococcus sp. PvP016]